MQRRHLDLLRQAAEQRLDLQKRAVLDQTAAVDALDRTLIRLSEEVEDECRRAADNMSLLPLLIPYVADCRERSAHLNEDLSTARTELESLIGQVRELYLEGRRYERLIELAKRAENRAETRRERRFLDWLGERRHGRS